MRIAWTFALGAVLGLGVSLLPRLLQRAQAAFRMQPRNPSAGITQGLLHTHREFEFIAAAPIDVAAPLFGAERERVWAPGWDPKFVWPENAKDQEGMVFMLAHGNKNAIWVNTSFDLKANRIQYVYVVPGTLVTVITLNLAPNERSTHVAVTYDRTALTETANKLVLENAEHDASAGPEWGKQINDYLKSRS